MGTRPEAIKLAPVVLALADHASMRVRVMATGQHRELVADVLRVFGIEPDITLDVVTAGQTLSALSARILAAVESELRRCPPAWVVVQGDTTSAVMTALAAFHNGVSVAHVEAGLRTGRVDAPFPEEMNRRLLADLCCLHFAPHTRAQRNLEREGVDTGRIEVVGNTVVDAVHWILPRVDSGKFAPPAGKRLLLVTVHRRENLGPPLERVCLALRSLARRDDLHVLLPMHPNPAVASVVRDRLVGVASVQLIEALPYPDFVAAMAASSLIATDSGGVQEEALSVGRPVLVLRDVTERLEGVEVGAAEIVGTDAGAIEAAVVARLAAPGLPRLPLPEVSPYGDGQAAGRIVARLRAEVGGG
ncbi:MAG: UDP-N-acetylglucosamine 2-epimerase (non-hydrolyzing) [Planctomycetota bacterium]